MGTEKRDFSSAKVEQIETFLNTYYGELEGNWFKSLFAQLRSHFVGFFANIFVDSYHGGYEDYLKNLSAARSEAVDKIRALWSAVERVESHSESAFKDIVEMTGEYTEMTKRLKDTLDVTAFTSPLIFDAVLPVGGSGYLHSLEYRAWEILKRKMPYSDQDLEILAYAYSCTSDDSLRERILSCFYKETRVHNGDMALDNCYYFERDEKQWDKFCAAADYYTLERYREYLKIDPNDPDYEKLDAQINEILRGNVQMHALDDRDILSMDLSPTQAKKEHFPIRIESGTLRYDTPDFSAIDKEAYERKYPDVLGSHSNQSYSSWTNSHSDGGTDWVANGAEGGHQVSNDTSRKIRNLDPPFNAGDTVDSLIKKGVEKGADAVVPGSGKVIKTIDKLVDTAQKIDDAANSGGKAVEYEKPYYSGYVDMFDMKCVSTDSGYTVYPTPSTAHKVDLFYDWLETQKQNAPNLYNAYQVNASVKDTYGLGDRTAFFLNKNGPSLMKDLSDANLLNSWEAYLESHT